MSMNNAKLFIYLILIVYNFNLTYSQNQFVFDDEEKRAVTLKFRFINNLIILSAILNGEEVDFLLDSGVNKTKIFSQIKDSVFLEKAEYISLRSFGSSEPVKAYKTDNNKIDFGPISSDNQEVYYITDPRFDLASKLGINVQGIIGHELLKDFIFRLNYGRKSLRVYQHHKFNRKLRSFEIINFRLIRKKPHIKSPVELIDGTMEDFVFLIDIGSSDAFWLFEDENINAPENSFLDYVGYGLENTVDGKRTKFNSATLGKYKLEEPRVAYIDSLSADLFAASRFKNGIIGNEILRRFVWFFDYQNQMLYFKPSRNFNDNTNYDRSGLVLMYVGEEITRVKTPIMVKIDKDQNYGSDDGNQFEIRIQVTKIIVTDKIRPNSPASKVDIQVGDRLLKLNGKSVNKMTVEDINTLFSSEEGKRVRIQLKRGNTILKREIYLSSQLSTITDN